MSAKYTLRFNISRPVGTIDGDVACAVTSRTSDIIDEHCIVHGAAYTLLTGTVAEVRATFLAANDNEAKAISYDAVTGGTQGTGVAVDAITVTGRQRITL